MGNIPPTLRTHLCRDFDLSLHLLSMSFRRGDVRVLEHFLESDPALLHDPARLAVEDEKNGGPPLYLAAVAGHVEAVRLLIQQRANVNTLTTKKGYTALTGEGLCPRHTRRHECCSISSRT